MPWVKLDDGFLTNPKVMRAGLEARAVYVAGLCYCAGGLTDGYVPAEALTKLGSLADVRKPLAAARQLLSVGLWESADGGYQVHDYLKYQPSAEDVRKERQRVAEWRAGRRNAVPNGVRNGLQNVYGADSETSAERVRNGVPRERSPVPSRPKTLTRPVPSGSPLPPLRSRTQGGNAASLAADQDDDLTKPTGRERPTRPGRPASGKPPEDS